MSYRQAAKRQYTPKRSLRQRISPTHQFSFRSQWEANLDEALAQAYKLKDEGYLVEEGIEKGALMESQAKRIIKQLTQMGYEVQKIPVAKWAGEKVVFIIYKPPQEPLPPPTAKTSKIKSRKQTLEQLLEKYIRLSFPPNAEPDMERWTNKGYMLNHGYTTALIRADAPGTDTLINIYKSLLEKPPITQFTNFSKLRVAVTRAKKSNAKFVHFDQKGETATSIEHLQNALRTFADGPLTVYCEGKDKPVYIANEDKHAIALAPALDFASHLSVSIDELIREAATVRR